MHRTSSRTIGTVEAFLILSEWPPRAEYLMDSVLPRASSSGDRANPAKVYDDLSWTLIGLVSVAASCMTYLLERQHGRRTDKRL